VLHVKHGHLKCGALLEAPHHHTSTADHHIQAAFGCCKLHSSTEACAFSFSSTSDGFAIIVCRQCTLERDPSSLFYAASAIMKLQNMFGLIPRLQVVG